MTQEIHPSPRTFNAIIRQVSLRLGGSKAKEFERFIKFFFVGAIGFVVDFGTLNLLQSTILKPTPDSSFPVLLASGIAFTTAVSSNFIWNRYWTYPDSRSRPIVWQLIQFFLVNIAGLLFRLLIIALFYQAFGSVGAGLINTALPGTIATPELQDQLGTNLAQVLAVVIVMVWNFFVNRYWTYNDVE